MPSDSDALFPASPREIYSKAPLVQVICQLRFPSLLSIESTPPVEFQERIRDQFPLLEKSTDPLKAQLPPEIAKMIESQSSAVSHQFMTEDRSCFVTLLPESLALSATQYDQWEGFRDQLRVPLAALNDIYRPSFFTRIGLRYQDAIDRAKLGLQDVPWSELLRKDILGELALSQFEAHLENVANRSLRISIPDGSGSIMMRHGLGNLQGTEETCYMIDLDFFTDQKTEIANAEYTLNHFNTMAGHAFRWCISDTLRNALEPRELEAAPT